MSKKVNNTTTIDSLKEIAIIKHYLVDNIDPPIPTLISDCQKAKYAMLNLTTDDKINLITLASYWGAVIRQTYQLFVYDLHYSSNSFWDAYISIFVLHQHIMLNNDWKYVIDDDKEFQRLINTTMFPKWVYQMFIGMDYKWLQNEMDKFVNRPITDQ